MKVTQLSLLCLVIGALTFTTACNPSGDKTNSKSTDSADVAAANEDFNWEVDRFADVKVLRYKIPGFDKLSVKQKALVYYLTQAGLEGRDIMWDQNYQHNLAIRKAIEGVMTNFKGERSGADWDNFMTYSKRVWFSNGIHHHYAMNKFNPEFSKAYFEGLLSESGAELNEKAMEAMFNPAIAPKKVELDPKKGLLKSSAVNFYGDNVTAEEVSAFYAKKTPKNPKTPPEFGINSKLIKNANGELEEQVYKIGGMYGPALEKVVYWLEKAQTVAENDRQKKALEQLAEFYRTGDIDLWDRYNITWAGSTDGDVDYINGFIEVYNDPMGYRGSYESVVQITDFEASERMSKIMTEVQWFEDNSPFMPEHKKANVKGVVYKVVNVAGEAGDASPSTPIGINLPNNNWIRTIHGSKSVSLGNIISAYDEASGTSYLSEFAHDEEEIELAKKYGGIAGKMHTALHEVVGHASGKLEEGVATPKETLKSYSSTLEEGRADLVGLYFILDTQMVKYGLIETTDVGKAEYDGYIRNGMLVQLRRLEMGQVIEEAHMRNRAWVSRWVYEKGQADNVIEKITRDGKTFYNITDYNKLRTLFGELLKEVQRIKSQGDYAAAEALVEGYGVQVDKATHQEVLDRAAKLNQPAYSGFVNPVLVPVTNDAGEITDVNITHPKDFVEQMLMYSKTYSNL